MKFINYVKYRDLDAIARARPAHFAYADRLREQGGLAIGGPLSDERGRRIGLLFIYQAPSKREALRFAQEDPFTIANALSSYEITEWCVRYLNVDLLKQANRSADKTEAGTPPIRLFASYAKYGTDKSRLANFRPAHWVYDQRLESNGKLALAGPLANDEGGLFVYNAATRDEAMSYREEDPFTLKGVIASYELLEWLVEGARPELLAADFAQSH